MIALRIPVALEALPAAARAASLSASLATARVAARVASLAAATLFVALLAAGPAGAQEVLSLDAFFGRWEGSALGRSADQPTADYGIRDMDVRIVEAPRGFQITWVTMARPGSLSGPEAAEERRFTTEQFVRAGPSAWVTEDKRGPGASFSRTWARLEGRSLYVYVLEIDEVGVYQLSRYQRTISQAGVMDLNFTRMRDGTTVRRVTGSLVPAAD